MKRFLCLSLMMVIILTGCQVSDEPVAYDVDELTTEINKIDNIKNVSITISGDRVLEVYDGDGDAKNSVHSVTKSITSLLMGIAIDYGYIESVDDLVSQYLDLENYTVDPRFYEMTIYDLLTMQSGFEKDGSECNCDGQIDDITFILNQPVLHEPGKYFEYNGMTSHLTSILLYKATGMNLIDFANSYLFGPMMIEGVNWAEDNVGISSGSSGLQLSLSDMAKIGQLILNKGQYNQNQLISTEWIELSTSSHVFTPDSGAYSNRYGFYWWMTEVNSYEVISAIGYGGQFISVVPELDAVITLSTKGWQDEDEALNTYNQAETLLWHVIIPHLSDIKRLNDSR